MQNLKEIISEMRYMRLNNRNIKWIYNQREIII